MLFTLMHSWRAMSFWFCSDVFIRKNPRQHPLQFQHRLATPKRAKKFRNVVVVMMVRKEHRKGKQVAFKISSVLNRLETQVVDGIVERGLCATFFSYIDKKGKMDKK